MAVEGGHPCVDCGCEVEIKTFDEWRCIDCETKRRVAAYLAHPSSTRLSEILAEYLRLSNELFIYTRVVMNIAAAIKDEGRAETVAGFARRVCAQFGRVGELITRKDPE